MPLSRCGERTLHLRRLLAAFPQRDGEIFVLDETDDPDPHEATPYVLYLVNGTLPDDTFMLGFGEDAKGNLYALANETGIPFEETGLG